VDKSTAAPVVTEDDNEDPLAVKLTRGEFLTREALRVATGIQLEDDAAAQLVDVLAPHERQELLSLSLRAQLRDILADEPVFSSSSFSAASAPPRESKSDRAGSSTTVS
jgi:hypothetical protein